MSDSDTPRSTMLYGVIEPSDTLLDLKLAPPLAGELHGRYLIGDLLGRGGMGEVLSARDKQLGRSVAIKRLRVRDPAPDVVARFQREAQIQGRLEHPAVVPVHEMWTDEHGQPFFVMKRLSGVTLAEVIARRDTSEKYGRSRLLRAFADVCLAIEFAHTRGVLHRDLKPANIVLGDFGEVYVLDWGIARVTGDGAERFADVDGDRATSTGETMEGAILGTPGYISPEHIRGDVELDGRADVYALGCILFAILAGEELHPTGHAGIASAVTGADARPSVRTPVRDVPPELDAICVHATAVERTERYATARELGEAVERFLDGDRDTALRRQLAASGVAAAQAALGSGDRRGAITAAARALAFDPTAHEAAALVGRLMLEPPTEMPVEVENELAERDLIDLRGSAQYAMLAAVAYLAFLPILYWVGFRELWYYGATAAISGFIILTQMWLTPRKTHLGGYAAVAGHLAMVALFSWLVTPVVIGPGIGTLMVVILAPYRLIRTPLLVGLACLATISPWILAQFGLAPMLPTVDASALRIHMQAASISQVPTLISIALYMASLVGVAGLLARWQDNDRRSVRRAMQLQSWQLRQLVPS